LIFSRFSIKIILTGKFLVNLNNKQKISRFFKKSVIEIKEIMRRVQEDFTDDR